MGAEAGRLSGSRPYDGSGGSASGGGGAVPGGETSRYLPVNFPNICRREWEAPAWTLLHQCGLDKWKDGHAGKWIQWKTYWKTVRHLQ